MKIYKIITPNSIINSKEDNVEIQSLKSNGLYHTSYTNFKKVKKILLGPIFLFLAFIIISYFFNSTSLLFLSVGLALYIFITYFNLYFNYKNALTNQFDIFIGYSFNDELPEEIVEITSIIYYISSFLWPTWGIITILHPNLKNSPNSNFREEFSLTASHWPFVLRPIDNEKWKSGVEWGIKKCKFAIFDMRNQASKGLQWEINLAVKTLGLDKIAFIINGANGKTVVVINGQEVETPTEIVKYLNNYTHEEAEWIILCSKIRKIAAEKVTVDNQGMKTRLFYDKFEGIKNKITSFFLKIAIVLSVVGIILLIKEILNL